MRMWVRPVAVVGAALMAAACGSPLPEDAAGAEVYQAVCATCHGAELGGQATIPPLGPGSPSSEQPRQYFVDTVTNGRGRMPSFARTLTSGQIDAVIDYVMEQQGR